MRRKLQDLERRLACVERELAALKAAIAVPDSRPWYRQIVGTFAGDPVFAEMVRLGQLIRRGKLKG